MIGGGKPRWNVDGLDWPHREASEFVSAGDIQWHVQRFGRGPPILLLHGTGAATHSWADLGTSVEGDFSIIAPDLPGHGFTSTPPDRLMSLTGMARSIGALLHELRVGPEIIVGHSAGAAILVELITSGLAQPRAALSINGALAPFGGAGAIVFPAMARILTLNPLVPLVFAQGARRHARVEKLIAGTGSRIPERNVDLYARLLSRPGHVAGALRMMANWNVAPLCDKLRTINAPIFFAAGERDLAVPYSLAADAAHRAPFGRHRTIKDLGHLAHEEDPEIFAALIRDIAAAP